MIYQCAHITQGYCSLLNEWMNTPHKTNKCVKNKLGQIRDMDNIPVAFYIVAKYSAINSAFTVDHTVVCVFVSYLNVISEHLVLILHTAHCLYLLTHYFRCWALFHYKYTILQNHFILFFFFLHTHISKR